MRKLTLILGYLILVACSGGVSIDPFGPTPPTAAPAAPSVTVDVGIKQLIFSWTEVSGATHYRLHENPDGHSGFTQVGDVIPAGTLSVSLTIAVHLQDFTNALYMVSACNASGCTGSTEVNAMNGALVAIGYFKASNTGAWDGFGGNVALSADGTTLAVGATGDDSNATGINGDQNDDSAPYSGAVYVFRFNGQDWSQQAYIKASNSETHFITWPSGRTRVDGDQFGTSIALSADGDTLAVGARWEDSSTTGINGDQTDNSFEDSGAVYVYRFDGSNWFQEAYIKASNTWEFYEFGWAVSLSADGDRLAVGSIGESSAATGINGDQYSGLAERTGAVYLYQFDGSAWSQTDYVKASNARGSDTDGPSFGSAVAFSMDGNTLAVGSPGEDGCATGINGDQTDFNCEVPGAAYLFRYDGTEWSQQAYIKASNTNDLDRFGGDVALSEDGNTLAVAAGSEQGTSTGVNGDQTNPGDGSGGGGDGAVYLFRFEGTAWFQQAYIKSSNGASGFGPSTLNADGNMLAVGGAGDDSSAVGINGDQNDYSAIGSGAVFLFNFDGMEWSQKSYIKTTNPDQRDRFGYGIAFSADGNTLAVGASGEDSGSTGINGDQSDNSVEFSGAVYLY